MENKPTLILCGSDKGGVGKTTVARALLDFFKEKGVRPSVFDTEPGEGVLRRFHKYAKPVDVGGVRGQMQVFDDVPVAGYTFVDLKAGVLSRVLAAMRDAGLLKDVHDGKMRMVVLHVLGSNEASLREIDATAKILAEGGEHILIKNHASDGLFLDWDQSAYNGYFKPTDLLLDIPHLDGMAADAVDAKGASFTHFMNDESNSRTLRGIVGHWLKQACVEFEKAKLC